MCRMHVTKRASMSGAALPLHGDARGNADLDPDAARAGLVGA
jgi:hypothetical protein